MGNEVATILDKPDQDEDERADEGEKKRLIIEKEEKRKRLILEAELEAQEQKHEMEMQSMMFGFLQQMQYATIKGYIIHHCMDMSHPVMQCATHLTSYHIKVHLVITQMMIVIISTACICKYITCTDN